MCDPANIKEVAKLEPDYMGFIFYDKSKRNAVNLVPETIDISGKIKKVGVFVNAPLTEVKDKYVSFGLDLVQLHGEETPQYCAELSQDGIPVMKVFAIGEGFSFDLLEPYKPFCDLFLFDTKGEEYGGNGVAFNWDILKGYDQEVPFFLSGGLGPDNIRDVKNLKGMNLFGIDINSRFELQPGLKDVELLESIRFQGIRNLNL